MHGSKVRDANNLATFYQAAADVLLQNLQHEVGRSVRIVLGAHSMQCRHTWHPGTETSTSLTAATSHRFGSQGHDVQWTGWLFLGYLVKLLSLCWLCCWMHHCQVLSTRFWYLHEDWTIGLRCFPRWFDRDNFPHWIWGSNTAFDRIDKLDLDNLCKTLISSNYLVEALNSETAHY